MSTSCRIVILGREIPVRTTAAPELVQQIEEMVNERLSAVAASMTLPDPQMMAVFALLNMAEEIVSLRKGLTQDDASAVRLARLVEQLDTGMAAGSR
jgi:cell division protein ZapA (FtsZ GTPase activity inhibitor)